MASALVRELIESGVHFGHRVSRWNPKMAPYIFGKRNSIHIIDIRQTVKGLLRAKKFVSAVVSNGQDVLFVGTKRQARESIEKQAKRVGMHFVSERWLGGTLTNFKTIRSRLARLQQLENEIAAPTRHLTKKELATIEREKRKITRNLDGIRNMTRLPGALIILDVRREHIAVKEAQKLGIPTICLVDTDSDPDAADIVIPANDDAMRALDIILTQLADAVEEGKRSRPAPSEASADPGAPGGARPRKSRRPTTSEMAERQVQKDDGNGGPMEAAMPYEAVAAPGREGAPAGEVTNGI